MNFPLRKYACFKFLGLIVSSTAIIGCGAVGSPIPPEDVGIEAKVRKQQKDHNQSEEALFENDTLTEGEEGIELPTFYPIGTR